MNHNPDSNTPNPTPTPTPTHHNTTISHASLSPLPHHPSTIPPKPTPSSSSSSSSSPACAACRYQRRKCSPNCLLAPFFPADKPQIFLNAHRLFGLSKIVKTLNSLDENTRPEAIRSIIFQSNARAQDPSGGCYRIVLQLQDNIQLYRARLEHVLWRISVIRRRVQILQAEETGSCNQDLEGCLDPEANFEQAVQLYNGGSELLGFPLQALNVQRQR